MKSKETVHHPRHYNATGPRAADGTALYEPIKVIEAWGLGTAFCLGSALKYIARAHHKGSAREDLEKAHWYLLRALRTAAVQQAPAEAIAEAWQLSPHLAQAVAAIAEGDLPLAANAVAAELDMRWNG